MMARLIESEGRWIRALLILSTITVALVLTWLVAQFVVYFSDIILVVVLAWLFAFVLSPLVTLIRRALPGVPRNVVVVSVYTLLFVLLAAIVLLIAAQLASSIAGFVDQLPGLQERLPEILAGSQQQLEALGFQVDLATLANQILTGIGDSAVTFVGPLQDLALASLATIGNLLFTIFLSLFIVIDKERLIAFVNRLTPPRFADEMRLFQTSVAQSFGGFIRGQAIQGIVYGAIAAVGSVALGIDYAPLTTALVAIFQMIPFFGPFVSWAPPVVAAILTESRIEATGAASPDLVIPMLIIMVIGWFIVMNIVQPRVMASSVGIHPVVVLVSVLLGLRLYGVVGAIFAIPVAAVISAFFFHYLNRSSGEARDVTTRAARRLEEREGRPVRVPAPPRVSSRGTVPLATATGLAGGGHAPGAGSDEPGRLEPDDRSA
jgi:predicted PurR-regulated permease PerM